MQSPVTAGWTAETILTHGRKWQLEASILHYKNAKLLQDHTKLQNPNVSTSSHRLQLSILLILTPPSACGGPNYKACIILTIVLLQDDFESVQSRKCSFYRHQTKGRNLEKKLNAFCQTLSEATTFLLPLCQHHQCDLLQNSFAMDNNNYIDFSTRFKVRSCQIPEAACAEKRTEELF